MEDYVQRFADLIDLLAAYDTHPDPLHYLTRFLDGLRPAVRVLVAIQQPVDLDAAYTMALLYEELGEGGNPFESLHILPPNSCRTLVVPPPPLPPPRWISKTVEEKKQLEATRVGADNKWSNLKAYRKARGLCFVCGEKWGKDHLCKSSIQLHVVQEMLHCMQVEDSESDHEEASEATQQLMLLSAAATNFESSATKTMQPRVQV
jgi:hypothetical protein